MLQQGNVIFRFLLYFMLLKKIKKPFTSNEWLQKKKNQVANQNQVIFYKRHLTLMLLLLCKLIKIILQIL